VSISDSDENTFDEEDDSAFEDDFRHLHVALNDFAKENTGGQLWTAMKKDKYDRVYFEAFAEGIRSIKWHLTIGEGEACDCPFSQNEIEGLFNHLDRHEREWITWGEAQTILEQETRFMEMHSQLHHIHAHGVNKELVYRHEKTLVHELLDNASYRNQRTEGKHICTPPGTPPPRMRRRRKRSTSGADQNDEFGDEDLYGSSHVKSFAYSMADSRRILSATQTDRARSTKKTKKKKTKKKKKTEKEEEKPKAMKNRRMKKDVHTKTDKAGKKKRSHYDSTKSKLAEESLLKESPTRLQTQARRDAPRKSKQRQKRRKRQPEFLRPPLGMSQLGRLVWLKANRELNHRKSRLLQPDGEIDITKLSERGPLNPKIGNETQQKKRRA
jgi:hypothetical protein